MRQRRAVSVVEPFDAGGRRRMSKPNYWVFSNKAEGTPGSEVWNMSWILAHKRYSFGATKSLRAKVEPGDVVYLRHYGESYIGRFVIGGEWTSDPELSPESSSSNPVGTFPMDDLVLWARPLPQGLIIRDLSNGDFRSRIVRITAEDAIKIETAQRVYERLGFGGADGEILILEEGLEEAIKPNLKKMGLSLASDQIRQQFSMGPGVGRSDLICTNADGDLVVVELKRGLTSDETIGQVLRYVGWAEENLATEGQQVHGWVVAGDYDEQLRLAAKAAKVKLWLVRLG